MFLFFKLITDKFLLKDGMYAPSRFNFATNLISLAKKNFLFKLLQNVFNFRMFCSLYFFS